MTDQMREEFEKTYARDQRRRLGVGDTIPKSAMTLVCTFAGFGVGVFCVLITLAVTS